MTHIKAIDIAKLMPNSVRSKTMLHNLEGDGEFLQRRKRIAVRFMIRDRQLFQNLSEAVALSSDVHYFMSKRECENPALFGVRAGLSQLKELRTLLREYFTYAQTDIDSLCDLRRMQYVSAEGAVYAEIDIYEYQRVKYLASYQAIAEYVKKEQAFRDRLNKVSQVPPQTTDSGETVSRYPEPMSLGDLIRARL